MNVDEIEVELKQNKDSNSSSNRLQCADINSIQLYYIDVELLSSLSLVPASGQ